MLTSCLRFPVWQWTLVQGHFLGNNGLWENQAAQKFLGSCPLGSRDPPWVSVYDPPFLSVWGTKPWQVNKMLQPLLLTLF